MNTNEKIKRMVEIANKLKHGFPTELVELCTLVLEVHGEQPKSKIIEGDRLFTGGIPYSARDAPKIYVEQPENKPQPARTEESQAPSESQDGGLAEDYATPPPKKIDTYTCRKVVPWNEIPATINVLGATWEGGQ